MNNEIKVFVLSLKDSKRIKILRKRLKKIKINFTILFGINGNKKDSHKKLKELYNKKKTENYIGRQLAFPEIAASYAHINAYKIIKKNKIKSAIIIEDDVYPSKALKWWIKNNIKIKDNYILSFYSYPALGFIYKKPNKINTNNKIRIHDARTHLLNSSCYQINLKTCEKILKVTNGKVCGVGDWPFNLKKNRINLGVTLPYLNTFIINNSNTADARSKFAKSSFNFKKKLPSLMQNILRFFYYMSYFPFFMKKYSNIDFYHEQFLFKYLELIKNIFSKKYYNTKEIFYEKNFYFSDIQKKIKTHE
jgi:GR25 family glycosyltransferase involved in LPS biosynthesis